MDGRAVVFRTAVRALPAAIAVITPA